MTCMSRDTMQRTNKKYGSSGYICMMKSVPVANAEAKDATMRQMRRDVQETNAIRLNVASLKHNNSRGKYG